MEIDRHKEGKEKRQKDVAFSGERDGGRDGQTGRPTGIAVWNHMKQCFQPPC